MKNPDRALISGVPELLVLQLLSRRPMYGYELAKAIRTLSGDAIQIGEGVLYPTLHALEERDFLRTKEREVNGRSRIYYEPTAKGLRRLEVLSSEWRRIRSGVESVFAGETGG